MSESIIAAIKSAVEMGEAPSASIFVEEAVRERLRELRRAKIYAAYEEAASDPEYLKAIKSDIAAFDGTLPDGARH